MIVAVNGEPLTREHDLSDVISQLGAGDEVALTVRPRRRAAQVEVELGRAAGRARRRSTRFPAVAITAFRVGCEAWWRRTSNRQPRRLLTIPARPDYLVLARLALSAVCRLTPLSPEEVADLKLAITEAANDFVDETRPLDDESRAELLVPPRGRQARDELEGPAGPWRRASRS